MASNPFEEKLQAVKQLLELFRLERMVYIVVTIVALVVLVSSAMYLIFFFPVDRSQSIPIGLGLFGSSGAITFTTSRLLHMWTQAFEAILESKEGDRGETK